MLRALDRVELFVEVREVLDALALRLGLYPYVEPEALGPGALLDFEMHRPLGMDDISLVFHREQAEVYRQLLDGESVMLSAPTSFGKSRVIDAMVASGRYDNIAIVVPTVALIDETRRRLARYKSGYKILTHSTQTPSNRNIIVVTQERLIEFRALPRVDFFVIDEFYKLHPQDDPTRAELLNRAFYQLLKQTRHFYLLGPAVSGLSIDAAKALTFVWKHTEFKTVASEHVRVRARTATERQEKLVDLCRQLRDGTIVFCKSPARAREVARWLIEGRVGKTSTDETALAAKWIGAHFHPRWVVGRAMSQGIGVHHGQLPRALAHYMVSAFNRGKLGILVCTSTLIEGVNTRAKNVVVFDHLISVKKYDYFTFNNIAGRAGRMGRHFVGNVFLFHDPPEQELPTIDIPVLSQSEAASTGVLLQMDEAELTGRSRDRIDELTNQEWLPLEVIRANPGLRPEGQVALAQEIRRELAHLGPLLAWSGVPTFEQAKTVFELAWRHLVSEHGMRFGVSSGAQLAWRIEEFRRSLTFKAAIASAVRKGEDVDSAVENSLGFARTWMGYRAPQLLSAVDRIQRSVLKSARRQAGDYSTFAVQVENLFRHPPLVSLEEYGIPLQVAEKLEALLRPTGDLDQVLARVGALSERQIARLDEFEQLLVREALAGL